MTVNRTWIWTNFGFIEGIPQSLSISIAGKRRLYKPVGTLGCSNSTYFLLVTNVCWLYSIVLHSMLLTLRCRGSSLPSVASRHIGLCRSPRRKSKQGLARSWDRSSNDIQAWRPGFPRWDRWIHCQSRTWLSSFIVCHASANRNHCCLSIDLPLTGVLFFAGDGMRKKDAWERFP